MHLEYSLNEDDLLNFNLWHCSHSRTARRTFWKSIAIFSGTFFVAMSFAMYKDGYSFDVFLVALICTLVAGIFYGRYYKSFVRRQSRKLLREGANRGLGQPVRLTFSEEGIRSSSALGEGLILWPAVERVVETPEYIYLYLSAINALIIPKERVRTDVPVEELGVRIGRLQAL